MFPHDGTGGWIPNPRYESADLARMRIDSPHPTLQPLL